MRDGRSRRATSGFIDGPARNRYVPSVLSSHVRPTTLGARLLLLVAALLVLPTGASAAGLATGATHACAAKTDGTVWCWGSNDSGELGSGSGSDTTAEAPTPRQVGSLTGAAAVTTGSAHSCALLADATVKCWGQNIDGQLGDGTGGLPPANVARLTPTLVSGLTGVAEVSAGAFHTCARKTDGTVWCWGFNALGQLGDGTTTNRATPVQVGGLRGATAITAGGSHTCAIVAGGEARCWGAGNAGQLGVAGSSKAPVAVPGLAGLKAISAGTGHTCVIDSAGGAQCWGANASGQLGDGSRTSRSAAAGVSGLGSSVASIAAGGTQTCAVTTAGAAFCWGAGTSGELGDGTTRKDSPTPVAVSGIGAGAVAVAAGASFNCALLSTGTVQCWGDGYSGQTGTGTWSGTTAAKTPVTVPGLGAVSAASTNFRTACGVVAGNVSCWGWGGDGNLGTGTAGAASPSPAAVTLPAGAAGVVADVGVGFAHTCVRTTTKRVFCWGLNSSGQLGDGSSVDASGPVAVAGVGGAGTLIDAESLSVGAFGACAIRTNDTLVCWGSNDAGQLGTGDSPLTADPGVSSSNVPVTVGGLTEVSAVSVGNDHVCAIAGNDDDVFCWGVGDDGQLGSAGGFTDVPVDSGVMGASEIGVGIIHSCARISDAVQCWGDDSEGQLGDGATNSSGEDAVVALATGATRLAVGGYHACAVTGAGVRCWGNNDLGQLGDGTLTARNAPSPAISGLSAAGGLALGFGQSCALNAGSLKCWGDAYYGTAGDGTAGGHYGLTGLAAPVPGLTGVVLPPAPEPGKPSPEQPKTEQPKTEQPKPNPPVVVPTTPKPPGATPTFVFAKGKLTITALLVTPTGKKCPSKLTLTVSSGKAKQKATVKTKKVAVNKKLRCSVTASIKLKPSKLKKAKSLKVKLSGKGTKAVSKTVKAT